MVSADSLKILIHERLGAIECYVEDLSGGCGQAIAVIIVSQQFQGKNKLARSRLVNSALKEEIAAIHAFQQKTFTPEEWATQRANYNV
ncbi:CYFA0S02e05556g1_1 [Cyberlindnera fabianii]|uniref:BolA-like protein 2 n=1 Tax=Cyberlindnera fabianii TaxID=36022 RepID=A0A061AMJ2_CYBFA|nr:BolA-like protein 2 [Cyberlindnera fabianii]CDR38777.1 CYFA0S02e05556g1_1 [Cyberlindnera fabianii]